ncbi:hypothetical protein FAM09_16855 [Niastella caeni]|uniref:Uncharacterized protein n=1 Tax=Niastella caeni TaxID=2569763 RepID=A0A4S8HSS8_9BACT|nr:hypothetical protein [Niastella caeni]THU38345.1 hypothetical protein FAM09_16855 [Niastella caeni]
MERSEQEYIAICKRQIEEKFPFGNGDGELRQRDLEYLADRIEERSGIVLSLSTLKRLWKKDYDKMPHPTTLQALVSVLGYKDWQEFKLRMAADEVTDPVASSITAPLADPITEPVTTTTIAPAGPQPRHRRYFNPWLLLPVAVAVVVLVWIIAFRSGPANNKPVIKGPVTFTGNKTVTQGVPNTIIFNYDVTNVDADSFFFQQSWNPLDKVRIDPKDHVYSNIYYMPGFHKAKLIANDSIIKRFRVHITTDGWLPLTRYSLTDSDPIYIRKEKAIRNGALHITRDDLAASNVDLNKNYILSYFNVREFENTDSDNFSLDTRILCDSLQTVACPGFDLVITCEEHIYFVRLMSKGCEREIAIKMGEAYHNGIHHDLSAFGRDLQHWQHLQVQVAGKKATIYLDEKPVYSITYKNDFGKVVGLAYNFTGTGAIDYVRLRNGANKLVYEEEFNQ